MAQRGARAALRGVSARAIAAALAICFIAGQGSAQSWTFQNGRAGLSVNGAQVGLTFDCRSNENATMTFSGFADRLQNGQRYTVNLTIDETAYVFRATARRGARFESVLSVETPIAELAPVIAALRAGRRATVAGPAGRYTVPLSGSADALAKACAT